MSTPSCTRWPRAVAEGAAGAGAEVRLRRVAELAAATAAIAQNPGGGGTADATAAIRRRRSRTWLGRRVRVRHADPVGTPAAQLKQFIDQAAGCGERRLADSGDPSPRGQQAGGRRPRSCRWATSFYHWGALIVPPGFTDPAVYAAGGTPTARR